MNIADKYKTLVPIHGNKLGLSHDGKLVCPEGIVVGSHRRQQTLLPRPAGNQFVKVEPTLRFKPYAADGTQLFTSSALTNGGTAAVDMERIDVTTGLPMAKMTLPNTTTGYQSLNYYEMTPWYMDDEDVWLMSVYLPEPPQATMLFQILVTNQNSIAGTEFRTYQFNANRLQQGYNTLAILNVETAIGSSTYGTVGTNAVSAWTNGGAQTKDSAVVSIRIRGIVTAGAAGDTVMYFGALHTAPAGWCTAAIMWSADDVPISFYNLALPIIEEFGWPVTFNASSGLTGNAQGNYISAAQYRALIRSGHEVWGHTYLHEALTSLTEAEKTTALTVSRDFWNAQGIESAARFLAYPTGVYDAGTITVAKSLGYKLATTVTGQCTGTPWVPGVNPFTLGRNSMETDNSWQADSILNGIILRGQATFTYMHDAYAGGKRSDVNPSADASSFYADHLRRWCELVKSHEEQGRVVCLTGTEYYKQCGINPYTHQFTE